MSQEQKLIGYVQELLNRLDDNFDALEEAERKGLEISREAIEDQMTGAMMMLRRFRGVPKVDRELETYETMLGVY